jgi:hypothetical protein
VPDHFKIAVKEFRSAIHHLNEAAVKFEHAAAHFFYVQEFDTQKEIHEAKKRLAEEIIPSLVKSLEKIIGPQDKN